MSERAQRPADPRSERRLRVVVFGAARTGRSRLVAELAAASPLLAPCEGRLSDDGLLRWDEAYASAPHAAPRAAALPHLPDLVLLTGLDLPASKIAPQEQARQDADLRQALQAAGLGWRVVYGQGEARRRNALQAVAEVAPWLGSAPVSEQEAGRWARLQANCETCGDAACEHRLFTRLAQDADPADPPKR